MSQVAAKEPGIADLPRPADRPGADVVIFDGECRFCQGQVRRLYERDTKGRLAFLSLHDEEVQRRYSDLSHEQLMQDMYVVDRQGRRHRGADAFRYLSTQLPSLYWLAPILHIPGTRGLWQWAYRQFATRRYLFGRQESCEGSCSVHFGQDSRPSD